MSYRVSLAAALALSLAGCSDDSSPLLDATADTAVPDAASADLSPDSGPVTESGVDFAADGPATVLLAIEHPCTDEGKIYPSKAQNEQGYLIAAKLTPESYPFTVTAVRYMIEASDKCNNTMAHRVEVTHGTQSAPDDSPTSVQTLDIAALTSAPAQRVVEQQLTSSIQLQAGEHLYVAVEMPEDNAGKLLCLTLCMGNGVPDHTFWSNATQPPYAWTALNGLSANAVIMALGHEG